MPAHVYTAVPPYCGFTAEVFALPCSVCWKHEGFRFDVSACGRRKGGGALRPAASAFLATGVSLYLPHAFLKNNRLFSICTAEDAAALTGAPPGAEEAGLRLKTAA